MQSIKVAAASGIAIGSVEVLACKLVKHVINLAIPIDLKCDPRADEMFGNFVRASGRPWIVAVQVAGYAAQRNLDSRRQFAIRIKLIPTPPGSTSPDCRAVIFCARPAPYPLPTGRRFLRLRGLAPE